ncbi:MAG: DUF1016 N-terminal domain-containing protein [Prevotellaceae bacterium]|jgi:predicted nuclease of restriction endonuclease-like (RecB) superfamily|nr:DUF1016 N-terminal domain-containing protein [Prevotellaceae bacterium]
MNIDNLSNGIQYLSEVFRTNAVCAVNVHITIRNWIIGCYIVEYEQNGEDRAKYGSKVLQTLSEKINQDGLSYRNLRLYRQFYIVYPQIRECLSSFFQNQTDIWQALTAKYPNKNTHFLSLDCIIQNSVNQPVTIWQTATAKFDDSSAPALSPNKIITRLSFSHIQHLLSISDPLKRVFYEIECIKGIWSTRGLKYQTGGYFAGNKQRQCSNRIRFCRYRQGYFCVEIYVRTPIERQTKIIYRE